MEYESSLYINSIRKLWNNYYKNNIHKNIINIDINLDYYKNILSEAEKGNLLHWLNDSESYFSYIVLMFFISKNIYKDEKYFINDYKTQLFIEMGIENYKNVFNIHEIITILSTSYAYSENINYQKYALKILSECCQNNNYTIEEINLVKHCKYKINKNIKILEKFKRFPERNYLLGRISTEDEIDYLDDKF